MRKWSEMTTDEIYSIWVAYLKTDFASGDPLNIDILRMKIPIRITAVEMVKMVEVLFDRLIDKEKLK
jgi:hypothetical protein